MIKIIHRNKVPCSLFEREKTRHHIILLCNLLDSSTYVFECTIVFNGDHHVRVRGHRDRRDVHRRHNALHMRL